MRKKHAFLISIIVTLVIAGNYLFFADIFPERESVLIGRVIDGDTVELDDARIIRLLNVNTPERGERGDQEAVSFMKQFEGKVVEMEMEGVERYGRILGRLYYDGRYINLNLVESGLAHSFLVDNDELIKFRKAEEKARDKEIGIWEKSEYYGCLNTEINKNDEYVFIENNCNLNLEGWSLKDESTNSYEFGGIESKKFTFYSGKGINSENEIFWKRGNAWNDDKDSIFIRDENGLLVYYDSYGY